MDINGKLTFISESIYELKHAQKQIWHRLVSDLNNSSEDSVKRFEYLYEHVYKLEAQCNKQYGKLKKITQLVLLLLEKVTVFNIDVETLRGSTDSTNRRVASENSESVSSKLRNNECDGYCMLNRHQDSIVSRTATTKNEGVKQETTVEGQPPTSSTDNFPSDDSNISNVSSYDVEEDSGSLLCNTSVDIKGTKESATVKNACSNIAVNVTPSSIPKCNITVFENDAPMEAERNNVTAQETIENNVTTQEARRNNATSKNTRRNNVTSQETRRNNARSRRARRNNVTSQESRRNNVTSLETRRNNVTSQEAQGNNVTSQEERRNNVSSHEAQRNNVTSQEELRNNVTSQEERRNNVSSHEAQGNNVTSQEERRNNVPSHEHQGNNITSQEAHGNNVTSQEKRRNNITSQEAQRNNVTSQEERRNNVPSHERQRNNITSQEAHGNNVTSQEAHGNNVTSQEAHGNNVTSQEAHGNNVTSQEERRNNVSSHEAKGNKVTSQEDLQNNVTSQEDRRNNVTSQEAQGNNVTSQESRRNNGTSHEHQGNNITSQEKRRNNITSQEAQGNNITLQEAQGNNITSQEARRNNVATVSKNDFGYKYKLSNIKVDNRVTFHSKLEPYNSISLNVEGSFNVSSDGESITEQPLPKPNITPNKSLVGVQQQLSSNHFHEFDDDNFHNDTYVTEQPRNVHEWKRYAELIRLHSLAQVTSGRIKRGIHGHDVVLVLDISNRMERSKFESLKSTALDYVDGIQQIYKSCGLEDNIGLATFGGETRLIHESTSDYDLIKGLICDLQPGGDAPLVAGMLMGLAGVLGGASSQIMDNSVPGHMIIFTDGTSGATKLGLENGLGVEQSYYTGVFRDFSTENTSVIKQIASHSIKIFYVPIAEPQQNIPLEKAVSQTGGKTIIPAEIYRLIRLTKVMLLAARVAADIRFSGASDATESIKRHIMQTTSNAQDVNDDCVEMVQEFINPLSAEIRKGLYVELKCYSLQLGDRVRRGPSWRFGDQDSHMAGTVIGQAGEVLLWVEWDNGIVNTYTYSEQLNAYTIQKVNEQRIITGEMIAVGCRVVRGPDWIFEDYDGGIGSLGTVLNVKEEGSVVVRWDCKNTGLYKFGYNELYEIQLHEDCEMAETTQYVDPTNQMSAESSQPNYYQQVKIQPASNTNLYDKTGNYGDNAPLYSDSAIAPTDMVVWEYKENNSTWTKYPPEINQHIEKAYQTKNKAKTIIKITQETYIVHFTDMIQENPVDKTKIQIRRRYECSNYQM